MARYFVKNKIKFDYSWQGKSTPLGMELRYKIVIADFTSHGGSHFYGLPYPSADSLDPMDHFCTFDVSKIIPKNMHYFPYVTFKPILMYIHGYNP